MQLFVRGEATRIVAIGREDCVASLKARIEDVFGVRAGTQIVSFQGTPLVGKVSDSVKNGSTVDLSMKLKGGREEEACDVDCLPAELYSEDYDRRSETTCPNLMCSLPDVADESQGSCTSMEHDDRPKDVDDHHKVTDDEGSAMEAELAAVDAMFCISLHEVPKSTPTKTEAPTVTKRKHDSSTSDHGETQPSKTKAARGHTPRAKAKLELPTTPTIPVMYPFPYAYPPPGCFFPPPPPPPLRLKGVAYDLSSVDERLRKRLVKNRQSAERSRQKKNDMMRSLEEKLKDAQSTIDDLQRKLHACQQAKEAMTVENEELRAAMTAHGVVPTSDLTPS